MCNASKRLNGRKARKEIPEEKRKEFDKRINVYLAEILKDAETVMVYSAIDGEVSVDIKGKELVFPRVEGENIVPVIKEKNGKFFCGAYGISEPEGEEYTGKTDAVVVPMCAFDGELNRLGFGKGYYDRFLQNRRVLKVGVAYSNQRCLKIDTKETDVKMDIIVTEKGVLGI